MLTQAIGSTSVPWSKITQMNNRAPNSIAFNRIVDQLCQPTGVIPSTSPLAAKA